MTSSIRNIRTSSVSLASDHEQRGIRLIDSPNSQRPRVALLGHAGYSTMVSNAGSGFSRSGDIAINRWRNDGTADNYGQWCYVRDLRSGLLWSSGHQPVCTPALSYRVTMSPERVSIQRQDGSLETRTDIVVVADRPAESRRVTIANSSKVAAELELTSYQEIVLATPLSDRGHRAFGNLFVQTEWLPERGSILAMRRPRSKETRPAWCGHSIAVQPGAGTISCETDRARFIGRGRTSQNPVAIGKPGELSGTAGAVLDPVFALRTILSIPPGRSAQVIFSTYGAEDREDALRMAEWFNDWENARHPFDEAPRDDGNNGLGIAASDSALYQDLAGLLLYGARSAGPAGANHHVARIRTVFVGTQTTANDAQYVEIQMMANAQPSMGKSKKKGQKPSLSQMQQQLNQKIQELKGSGKSGRQLSEELAEMAAEQERIRKALQEMQEKMQDEMKDGKLWNVEFDKIENVKDPG